MKTPKRVYRKVEGIVFEFVVAEDWAKIYLYPFYPKTTPQIRVERDASWKRSVVVYSGGDVTSAQAAKVARAMEIAAKMAKRLDTRIKKRLKELLS